jgi:hypothetical protein
MSDLNSLRKAMQENGLLRSPNTEAASSDLIPFFDDIFGGGGDEPTSGIGSRDCNAGCEPGCLQCSSGCSTCKNGNSNAS